MPDAPPMNFVAQIVTTAYVDKSKRPRRCDIKKFHVWRWPVGTEQPPDGMTCQCGVLTWTTRPNFDPEKYDATDRFK